MAMDKLRSSRAPGERSVIPPFVAVVFQATALALLGHFGSAMAATTESLTTPALEPELICRAALGSVRHQDPARFRLTRTDTGVLLLSYVRRIDNFIWTYRCKIEGNRVIWASEPGRWRDGPKDDRLSFELVADGKQLRIINDRGNRSSTKALFDLDKLR
jgi:hypothetical protein